MFLLAEYSGSYAKEQKMKPKTEQTYLSALKCFTKFLVKKKYVDGNVVQSVLLELTDKIKSKKK